MMCPHTTFKVSNTTEVPSSSQYSGKSAASEISAPSEMQQQYIDQPGWLPWALSESRVVEFQSHSENTFSLAREFKTAESLEAHFRLSRGRPASLSRRIYILEGLSTGVVHALQQQFQLHTSLFKDQERLVPHGDRPTGEGGGIPFLPSAVHWRKHVTCKYHEPVVLSCRPNCFRNLCSISGRHIAATRLLGQFSNVVILRRKCLLVCDPPVEKVITDLSGRNGYEVAMSPYQGGYGHIVDQASQAGCGSPSTRISFLEDMAFYIVNHSKALNLTTPESVRDLMAKIVAGHYLKLSIFMQSNIELLQWDLSRRQSLTDFEVSKAEREWSDVQSWERRVAEYEDDLAGIMVQLQIPRQSYPADQRLVLHGLAADYQYLYHLFGQLGRRTSGLSSAIAALASIVGNRAAFKGQDLALQAAERAGHEAKTMKALTTLGFIFIPLTYISSIFSMSSPYGPGGHLFWVYFAVSLSSLGAVLIGYAVLHPRQCEQTASRWSLGLAVQERFTNILTKFRKTSMGEEDLSKV